MLHLPRRSLLTSFGAGLFAAPDAALAQPVFAEDPFQLGVAAGDPLPDGFVIWTRLAPRPLEPDHGMPAAPMAVTWEVALDEGFATVVAQGEAVARPELAHAVHVEVEGLQPGRPYVYRFRCGGEASPVGRARTAPAPGAVVDRARFVVLGCQSFEHGFYTGHARAAAEDADFVYCYGDYIYEGAAAPTYTGSGGTIQNPRVHLGGECYSLDDYRRRYAQYKMDPDLQASHAATAWFCTFDDHDVHSNWVGDVDEDGAPPEVFRLRRQSAFQAYYEHMPLRRSAFPTGSAMQMYRNTQWGDLLDLHLLDTRQHRSIQPCENARATTCAGVDAAEAQVLGEAQEAWLYRNLDASRA
ncbi:MAG: alkaline phosphatase, partial [Brevundimonas sp.]